jgi:hypothetical protein
MAVNAKGRGWMVSTLQRLMSDVPNERRDEILYEIEEHIDERLSALPDAGDAEVRNLLARLGSRGHGGRCARAVRSRSAYATENEQGDEADHRDCGRPIDRHSARPRRPRRVDRHRDARGRAACDYRAAVQWCAPRRRQERRYRLWDTKTRFAFLIDESEYHPAPCCRLRTRSLFGSSGCSAEVGPSRSSSSRTRCSAIRSRCSDALCADPSSKTGIGHSLPQRAGLSLGTAGARSWSRPKRSCDGTGSS